ncbi:MAG: DUF4157 domain-containing protein, partial [Candidatus Limnocylindrales bacterium]
MRDRTRLQLPGQTDLAPARHRPVPSHDETVEVGALHAADLGHPAALAPAAIHRLQQEAGNSAVASLMSDLDGIDPIPGSGRPLDTGLATRMAQAFGTDFSDVRVHSGSEAAASAAAFEARAYTIGNDIVQGPGAGDDRTMAHELAHVVQQRNGPVGGSASGGSSGGGAAAGGTHVARFSLSDPFGGLEQAAESAAGSAVSGLGSAASSALGGAESMGGSLMSGAQSALGGAESLAGRALGSIPGLGGGMPSIPGMGSIPGLGGGMPSIPGMGSIPGLGGGMPSIPGM